MSYHFNNYLFSCNTLYKTCTKTQYSFNSIQYLNINITFPDQVDQLNTVKKKIQTEKRNLNKHLNLLFLLYITLFKKPIISLKKSNCFFFNLFVYKNRLNKFLQDIIGVLKPFLFLQYRPFYTIFKEVNLFYFKSSLTVISKMYTNSNLNSDLRNLRNILFFFNFKIN